MNNQLRLHPRSSRKLSSRNSIIKLAVIIVVCFLGIVLLDKVDFPAPKKLIEQKITNDKLITVK